MTHSRWRHERRSWHANWSESDKKTIPGRQNSTFPSETRNSGRNTKCRAGLMATATIVITHSVNGQQTIFGAWPATEMCEIDTSLSIGEAVSFYFRKISSQFEAIKSDLMMSINERGRPTTDCAADTDRWKCDLNNESFLHYRWAGRAVSHRLWLHRNLCLLSKQQQKSAEIKSESLHNI